MEYEKIITDAVPSEGTSRLVINIYGLNAGKATAIGNVVITGDVIQESTGGITTDTIQVVGQQRPDYYNLNGQRIARPAKGIAVEAVSRPGQGRTARKIIVK